MRIAVIGAGIAGLTSALALARGGHEVTVLERRTGFSETGAGIQLSPNATSVLRSLGLETAIRRVSSQPERIVVRSLRSGSEIASVALGSYAAERFGAPYLSVARQDLHAALLDAVRSNHDVRLRVGRQVGGLVSSRTGVRVGYEASTDPTTELEVDLAVGADGLWSSARRALGDERDPTYGGYTAYRSTLARELAATALGTGEPGLWLGPGCHVVHYPIASGGLANVVVVARRREPVEGWSAPVDGEAVLETLGRVAAPLSRLITASPAWSAWSLFDLPAQRLPKGRVALVGDAWHPALPFLAQGGALAIEDAAALAAELACSPQDPAKAIGRYSRARLGRVRRVQAHARRNGRVYHAGWPLAAMRNIAMRRLGPEGMTRRYDWLYAWTPPSPA